ncbi:amino acid ABC transporter substrate-binding protein [Antrihabitans sp. YC3-6]|uniref:Amino acid ABC transporter substrate-binding protein n=1 Tax=Antrihabitans stalagmiti TaxID=2799499 RepID=A0A934U2A7_9NOCA|nr:ABC transporter substrate-binding protein [Antrihabitans stalagmiti]MBJ8339074.1 amino acid ABC transporter substrate-binding protein [Antrihabitans stalagmiti]
MAALPPLRIGAALPDPPFELYVDGAATGFDIEFTQAIARVLGRNWELVPYEGTDFNGIFTMLDDNIVDCIASGTTVTPGRRERADFCSAYFQSGQSIAVDTERLPHVRGIDDLEGLTIGVQQGNTSQPIANALVAQGRAEAVRTYDYHDIGKALDDLSSGGCDVVMKLAPVLTWLVRDRQNVDVVQRAISHEEIAVAVRKGDGGLRGLIDGAQRDLTADGTLARLVEQWLDPRPT